MIKQKLNLVNYFILVRKLEPVYLENTCLENVGYALSMHYY